MAKRYEKFEGWMIGKTVLWDSDKGVVTRKYEECGRCAWVEWEQQGMGEAWIEVNSLVFLNVEDKSEQENKPIPWRVGQVVWDVVYGKGCVKSVTPVGVFCVHVDFGHIARNYNQEGVVESYPYQHGKRSLFFSEPKIEAELFPPKKPFVPKLKKGDKVLIKDKQGFFGEGTVRVVHKECDDRIYISDDGHYFMKYDIASLHVIGEEVKFEET